jgi:DNA-binding MarR family transcriptional regulator
MMRGMSRADDRNGDYPLDPVLDFLRVLWSVEHGLQRSSKRMETTIGVTGPQRLVLRIVARFPGLTAGELAHIIQLHPSTITGILQRLASRRLLARETDPQDNRRVRLRLLPRAQPFTKNSSGPVERAVRRALDQLGDSQVRAARTVLGAVATALDEANGVDVRSGRPARPRRQAAGAATV